MSQGKSSSERVPPGAKIDRRTSDPLAGRPSASAPTTPLPTIEQALASPWSTTCPEETADGPQPSLLPAPSSVAAASQTEIVAWARSARGSALAEAPRALGAPRAPVRSDRYEELGLLGRGGVGEVVRVRDRKLGHLAPLAAEVIVSANIGCIQHLGNGTSTPVRHWVEVLDDALG